MAWWQHTRSRWEAGSNLMHAEVCQAAVRGVNGLVELCVRAEGVAGRPVAIGALK